MKLFAWRLPLGELPKPAAWVLLFVAPVVAGIGSVLVGGFVFDLIFPYILFIGGLSATLEIRASKRIRVGGVGDMGLVAFRNVSYAGFLIAASLIVGVVAGTIIANCGVEL
jgi:hypothetical protein